MSLKFDIRCMDSLFFIYSIHLPPVTLGVGVTTESLEVELVGRCVLLVKGYRILDSMSK